jgi:hypothetical protein
MPYADPDMQRAAQREHARRKRATGTDRDTEDRTGSEDVEPVVEPLVPPQLQIEKAEDLLDVLTRQVRAIESSKTADPLMKARAIAQIAAPLLRAVEARDTAIARDIDGRLANLEAETLEAATDLIARVVRAVVDALPLTPEQRSEAPHIVRVALRQFGTDLAEEAATAAPAGP